MKKLKELIYWIVFVIYEELIMAMLIFGKKANTVIAYILTLGECFIMSAQLIYYKIYEAILSVYSIINGGQVTEFITTILDEMAQNWLRPCINLYTICNICNTTPNKGFKI